MGAGGSKTSGNAASTAAKTVTRRRLPSAPSASSVLLSDATQRSQTEASTSSSSRTQDGRSPTGRKQDARSSTSTLDPGVNFFRPLSANDGNLSPVMRHQNELDIEARMKEKDVTLVRRMDQLMGSMSMSKIAISGHAQAAERVERRRIANMDKKLIKVPEFAALFRVLKETQRAGKEERIDPQALAVKFGGDTNSIANVAKFYRHVDPTQITVEQKPGAPPVLRFIKTWHGSNNFVTGEKGNTIGK